MITWQDFTGGFELSFKGSDGLPSVLQPCFNPLPIDAVAIRNGGLAKAAPGLGYGFDEAYSIRITPESISFASQALAANEGHFPGAGCRRC